jgi:hypothetical protein
MNNFEVLCGMSSGLVQRFYRDNSETTPIDFLQASWIGPADGFASAVPNHVSLIVSRFGSLEAVVTTQSGTLQHWIRDFTGNWELWAMIDLPAPAIGPPSLIQGTYGSANLEVLVPLKGDQFNNGVIAHFYQDNSDPTRPWYGPTAQFAFPAVYVALIQSDYGNAVPPGEFSGGPGNLECVVTVGGFDALVHWWRDQDFQWHQGAQITGLNTFGGAGGCPAMATFGSGLSANSHADFEVIVPTSFTPPTLAHYVRDNLSGSEQWSFVGFVGDLGLAPGIYPVLITSADFQSLELIVAGNSTELVHLRRSANGGAWTETATFAPENGGGTAGFVELEGSGGQ